MYEACDKYKNFLKVLNLEIPKIKENDLNILTDSINQARLANNPITLNRYDIRYLYKKIMLKELI